MWVSLPPTSVYSHDAQLTPLTERLRRIIHIRHRFRYLAVFRVRLYYAQLGAVRTDQGEIPA